jgi:hypothetical protein
VEVKQVFEMQIIREDNILSEKILRIHWRDRFG